MDRSFLVHYKMTDPKGFWKDLEGSIPNQPKELKILFSAPNKTGTELVTLWSESESGALDRYLKLHPGKLASYEVMEVDLKRTLGLPI
jgi:hypothetical protein